MFVGVTWLRLKKMTPSVLGLCVFPCSTDRAEGGALILPPFCGCLVISAVAFIIQCAGMLFGVLTYMSSCPAFCLGPLSLQSGLGQYTVSREPRDVTNAGSEAKAVNTAQGLSRSLG